MPPRIRELIRSNLIGFAAIFIALGSVAYAAIPNSSGVFTACYATTSGIILNVPHSKGDLRLIEATDSCRSYEKRVTWNEEGQPGQDGLDGQDGVSGYEVVLGEPDTLDTRDASALKGSISIGASCPDGKRAVGGGWRLGGATGGGIDAIRVDNNAALGNGWVVSMVADPNTPFGRSQTYRAVAVCAIVN